VEEKDCSQRVLYDEDLRHSCTGAAARLCVMVDQSL
jgi:hypothetical protein